MTKITFKNNLLDLFTFLTIVAILFITYHFLNGRIFRLDFSVKNAYEIGLSLLAFSLICRQLSHKLSSREFSFNSIEDYEIEDNNLKIFFKDNSEKKFNLRFLDEKDIERLDIILDIHIHEFLQTS